MTDYEQTDNGMEADLVVLLDEEGTELQFELVDSAEVEGNNYVALVPTFDDPEDMLDDSGELVILRVVEVDGEELLEVIDDEEEFQLVGQFFTERLADQFDFQDLDEEEL